MAVNIASGLAWFIVGMLTGAISAEFVANRGRGQRAGIGIGIAGAMAGGMAMSLLGVRGQPGLLLTTFAAFVGAAALLAALGRSRLPSPGLRNQADAR